MNSGKSRAIVLLSGGMDSCVCAALAVRDFETAAVHVSYGQRTEVRERHAFLAICERLGIHQRLMVKNEALRAIGGSALTDKKIAVPESGEIGAEIFFPAHAAGLEFNAGQIAIRAQRVENAAAAVLLAAGCSTRTSVHRRPVIIAVVASNWGHAGVASMRAIEVVEN